METEYYDGDIVLVETCPDVAVGEIGIFVVNDQGYIKQRGKDRLISLNPECDDVFIQEGDVVYCRGRVLGKAELVKYASQAAYPTSTTPINTKAASQKCRFFFAQKNTF